MSIVDFLVSVNGVAQLWAADGQFLGVLSSNLYDQNSISNPHGIYGGSYGMYSIQNSYGLYGSQYGLYSPYNIYCLNPPIVLYQGQPVLIVTRNSYVLSNNLPVVDPELLLGVYAPQIINSIATYNPQIGLSQNIFDMFK